MALAGLQIDISHANLPLVPKHCIILQSGETLALMINESSFKTNLVFSFSEEAGNEGTYSAGACQEAPSWL